MLAVGADIEGIDRHVMVFPDPEGAPSGITQHRGDRGVLGRNVPAVAWKARSRFGNRSESILMMVAAGEEGRARRRTHGSGVPLRIGRSILGEPIECRHL